jgi:hypothetical protein
MHRAMSPSVGEGADAAGGAGRGWGAGHAGCRSGARQRLVCGLASRGKAEPCTKQNVDAYTTGLISSRDSDHYICIMIFPKDGKVVVFDSLRMEKATYNDFLKILEKYDYYCTLVLITT